MHRHQHPLRPLRLIDHRPRIESTLKVPFAGCKSQTASTVWPAEWNVLAVMPPLSSSQRSASIAAAHPARDSGDRLTCRCSVLPGYHRKKCRFERPLADKRKTGTDPEKPLDTFGAGGFVISGPGRRVASDARLMLLMWCQLPFVSGGQCRPGRSTGGCAGFETGGIHSQEAHRYRSWLLVRVAGDFHSPALYAHFDRVLLQNRQQR